MNRLTHTRVWNAIDALARRYSLSPSGLAKRAGLDPTSFNKSKRVTGEGRPRWPTTESIAKVLQATGASAYALEVTGDSVEPLYRDGDILIVSPNSAPRKGDRMVLRTTDGEVMAKILVRRTTKTVELASFNPAHPNLVFPIDRIDWMARIVWANQVASIRA